MDLDTLIITAFVTIDDALSAWLGSHKLRQRGPQPLLSDSEVLTIEADHRSGRRVSQTRPGQGTLCLFPTPFPPPVSQTGPPTPHNLHAPVCQSLAGQGANVAASVRAGRT